jgi:pimeloyl-ACP methyl ester carboxylesterase
MEVQMNNKEVLSTDSKEGQMSADIAGADLRSGKEGVTLQTAPTLYVDGGGIRFAWRRLGPKNGIPLVLLQHFSGNIDAWDPAVVNALADERPVIVFDNAGVGRSTGQTPDSVEAMARDAITFITSLGLHQVDLLGFSLGGCVAQQIASVRGDLVRKLILVGTAPQGGEQHLMAVLQAAFADRSAPDPRLPLFFTSSANSQSAGFAFLQRTRERTEDRDVESGSDVNGSQAKALISWCAVVDPEHTILRTIDHPTLVVSGSADTMLPVGNAYTMYKAMKNAQLILYPDSGHGVMFQYPDMFVGNALNFLKA